MRMPPRLDNKRSVERIIANGPPIYYNATLILFFPFICFRFVQTVYKLITIYTRIYARASVNNILYFLTKTCTLLVLCIIYSLSNDCTILYYIFFIFYILFRTSPRDKCITFVLYCFENNPNGKRYTFHLPLCYNY